MKTVLKLVLYLVLLAVVLSSVQSLWIGIANKARYQSIFPGAQGILYWTTLVASFLAGLNSIFIALRKRWAFWLNPLIGACSIALLEATGGPRINEMVVLVACTVSTVIPFHLWESPAPRQTAMGRFE